MKGGKNKQPLGYTIVEIMVVLTVSGVIFLIAANFINGKQQRAAFTSGINTMSSQVQDVIEQVTDGKYSDIPQGCNSGGGSLSFPGTADQGTNTGCVFLGKLLQFSNNSTTYTVSSLAGARSDGKTTPTLTPGPNSVLPTIIPNLDITQDTPQSLNVVGSSVTDSSGTYRDTYFVFGFVQNPGTSAGGDFQAGAQTVGLFYSKSPSLPPAHIADLYPAKSVTLCLSDGRISGEGTRKAKLVIGGAGSQLNVDVESMDITAPCQ